MECFVDKIVNEDFLVCVVEVVVGLVVFVKFKLIKLIVGSCQYYLDDFVGCLGDCFDI